ncbi:MAG: phospholipase A [Candidatus Krumholzibacteria bacterium]|nr:phospholipase A [Candidatus Krumholzibacteria bacterium]
MRYCWSGSKFLLWALPFVLVAPGLLPAQAAPYEFSLIDAGSGLTLHKEMFLQPFTYSNKYDGKQTEVVFQLSGKYQILGSRLYLGYTQISYWQAYDLKNSSPFRETNYNPELFYRFQKRGTGAGLLGADVGFEHESNGQAVPLSRSWNLLFAAPYWQGDNWLAYVKLRYRIPESAKETPESGEGDDNPDITDYLGWSDVHLYYHFPNCSLVHLLMRGYIGTDKGLFSLKWSVPLLSFENTWLVISGSSGYGESLADYNRSVNRVGIGVMFNR